MRRSMVPHGEDAWKENIWPAEKFHFYNFSLAAGIFLFNIALHFPLTC